MTPFRKFASALLLTASLGAVAAPVFAAVPATEEVGSVSTLSPFVGLPINTAITYGSDNSGLLDALTPGQADELADRCDVILSHTSSFQLSDVNICNAFYPGPDA